MVEKNTKQKSSKEQYAMVQWLNRNHREISAQYKGEYIAHNANRVIAHGENLQEVLEQAKSS